MKVKNVCIAIGKVVILIGFILVLSVMFRDIESNEGLSRALAITIAAVITVIVGFIVSKMYYIVDFIVATVMVVKLSIIRNPKKEADATIKKMITKRGCKYTLKRMYSAILEYYAEEE